MIRAIWNDTVLAETERTRRVEGNHRRIKNHVAFWPGVRVEDAAG